MSNVTEQLKLTNRIPTTNRVILWATVIVNRSGYRGNLSSLIIDRNVTRNVTRNVNRKPIN